MVKNLDISFIKDALKNLFGNNFTLPQYFFKYFAVSVKTYRFSLSVFLSLSLSLSLSLIYLMYIPLFMFTVNPLGYYKSIQNRDETNNNYQ